jgi:hypothetical protein
LILGFHVWSLAILLVSISFRGAFKFPCGIMTCVWTLIAMTSTASLAFFDAALSLSFILG